MKTQSLDKLHLTRCGRFRRFWPKPLFYKQHTDLSETCFSTEWILWYSVWNYVLISICDNSTHFSQQIVDIVAEISPEGLNFDYFAQQLYTFYVFFALTPDANRAVLFSNNIIWAFNPDYCAEIQKSFQFNRVDYWEKQRYIIYVSYSFANVTKLLRCALIWFCIFAGMHVDCNFLCKWHAISVSCSCLNGKQTRYLVCYAYHCSIWLNPLAILFTRRYKPSFYFLDL